MHFGSGTYHPMTDYFNAMDQQTYDRNAPIPDSAQRERDNSPIDVGLGVKDIGMSVPMGISAQNVQGIYSKIRMGAGNIEIGFPGVVRGSRQQMTPEMFGADQRQAIRELGALNEVKFTTHAAYGIMGLSGFTGDNPYNVWFQREQRKVAVDEVKRAIDFARDTAGGGSVVVHTGEVDRPISEMPWDKDSKGRPLFKHYEEEPEVARIRVVDERTGQVMQQVRKNVRVYRPKWIRADHDYEGEDSEGNKVIIQGPQYDQNGKMIWNGDYLDYFGRKIPDDKIYDHEYGRVPEYDNKTRKFINTPYGWDEMKDEAFERNTIEARKRNCRIEDLPDDIKFYPEEVYLRSTLETNEGHSRGWSMQYGIDTVNHIENIERIKKTLKFYETLESDIPEEEKWKIREQIPIEIRGISPKLIPSITKNPTEILQKALEHEEKALLFSRQSSDSQLLQAEDSAETQKYLISADKYAVREAVKSYAELGIHAMEQTTNKKNPLFISMENIFPERYGSHPEEIKILVRKSRQEMVNRLSKQYIDDPSGSRYSIDEAKNQGDPNLQGQIKKIKNPYFRGVSEEEARKAAVKHIKITFDTGHMNMWRKYWQSDPNKSQKENDKTFNKWYLKQVEGMAKEGIIGNMHLVDNYGYQDDHLSPGQGNVPLKETIKILKKYGYKGAWTVEPGADASTDLSDFHGLMKTWRHFGSPIYGVGMRAAQPQNFGDVHYSYFGQNKPPSYVFGAYSPSNDWTLWTAVPME